MENLNKRVFELDENFFENESEKKVKIDVSKELVLLKPLQDDLVAAIKRVCEKHNMQLESIPTFSLTQSENKVSIVVPSITLQKNLNFFASNLEKFKIKWSECPSYQKETCKEDVDKLSPQDFGTTWKACYSTAKGKKSHYTLLVTDIDPDAYKYPLVCQIIQGPRAKFVERKFEIKYFASWKRGQEGMIAMQQRQKNITTQSQETIEDLPLTFDSLPDESQ